MASSSKLDFDLVPAFQRVSVSGEDTSGVCQQKLVQTIKLVWYLERKNLLEQILI